MVETAVGVDCPRKEKVRTHKVSVPRERMPIAKDVVPEVEEEPVVLPVEAAD